MKLISSIVVILASVMVFAADAPRVASSIRYYNANLCSFWNYMSPQNTVGGYVCSSYPSMAQIPEAQSTQMVIDQLEARIRALEAKVGQ